MQWSRAIRTVIDIEVGLHLLTKKYCILMAVKSTLDNCGPINKRITIRKDSYLAVSLREKFINIREVLVS